MIIKQGMIENSLAKSHFPVYIITGEDPFLQTQVRYTIKQSWLMKGICDTSVLTVSNKDWDKAFENANNYSLFSELMLLDIRCNQKSIDTASKTTILNYLNNYNDKTLIIISAPYVPSKQLKWLLDHKNAVLINVTTYNKSEFLHWIKTQFESKNILFEVTIPELIYQYSQNNLLSASQLIEKLSLIYTNKETISEAQVIEYLTNDCEYPVYDLADACLSGNPQKSIDVIRKISQNRAEPLYILWVLSQEIRLLIQLKKLVHNKVSFSKACAELKIWSNRVGFYEKAFIRLTLEQLYTIITLCGHIDETIKTISHANIWGKIEQLALIICFGWELND
jgi:DNA polymerase-3 subunit delta